MPAAVKREREIEVDEEQDEKIVQPQTKIDDEDPSEEGFDNEQARREEEEDLGDERLSHQDDEDEDGDTPRERESRRKRRNRARREAQSAARDRIAHLEQELQAIRVDQQRQQVGQIDLYVRGVENEIAQLQAHLDTIEQAQAVAVKEGDEQRFAQARRLEREATYRLQELGVRRQRAILAAQAAAQPPQAPAQPQAPDPIALRYSREFLEDHPWFNPSDVRDEDSQIVHAIDVALTNEGYAHNSREFWDELRRRVEARGLGEGNMDEDDDYDRRDESRQRDTPRREARRERGGLPPRGGRGASRPAGSSRFTLTNEMRDALESEGLLDEKSLSDDQRKYRERLVGTWRKGFDEARKAGKL